MNFNKRDIFNALSTKARKSVRSLSEVSLDKKTMGTIQTDLADMFGKTSGDDKAAAHIADKIFKKYKGSAEAKEVIKNILDIKL